MNITKKTLKIKGIMKYFIFVFAFVCLGFSMKSTVAEAAPVISIPTDESFDYNSGLSFYVGYDMITVNSVKYSFDNSNWTNIDSPESNYSNIYKGNSSKSLCSSYSFISECTEVILEYHLTNLPNSKSTGVNDNGKFTLYVQASNKAVLVGGNSSTSRTLTYDGTSPTVSSVSISNLKTILKSGDELKFTVKFSEPVMVVGEGAKISFKIGGSDQVDRYALCNKTSGYSQTVTCSYTVANSVNGSISDLAIAGGQHISDQYSNSVVSESIGSSLVTDGGVIIDTKSPSIISLMAQEGVFSTNKQFSVEVAFSENLQKVSGSDNYPQLIIKFGSGENKECVFDSLVGSKLYYVCTVGDSDQGALHIVSMSGNDTLSDAAGNVLNLAISNNLSLLESTKADNNMPMLETIDVDADECLNDIYCKTNDQIRVDFVFNRSIEFTSYNISLLFDGVNASSRYSATYDETTKTLSLVYSVVAADDGKLSVIYNFVVKDKINQIVNSFSGEESFNVCVDNLAPVVENLKVKINDTEVEGKVIYGSIGSEITMELDAVDASGLVLDVSKIYLTDENNNRIYVSEQDISSITSALQEGKLTIKLLVAANINMSFKLKIEKEALKDVYSNGMVNDYYSEVYKLDCSVPSFELTVKYPEYKGYKQGNTWTLIGGNEIQFVVNSSDVDLKDYCVYVNSDVECEYKELVLGSANSYTFSGKGQGKYSFSVQVRDSSLNTSVQKFEFVLHDMFGYSNGLGTIQKQHSITIDTSLLSNGSMFKYAWFRQGSSVIFNNANTSSKTSDSNSFVINGSNDFNGNYRTCILIVDENAVLCSEYVSFDTKIDSFTVNINTSWTNESIYPEIVFDDISAIRCIAIGKNVSSLNCTTGGENKSIYKTSQISNPFNTYEISSNANYYFYIEDMIGNSMTISKQVNNIDKEDVAIEVFNGFNGGYDTNLEVEVYKKKHELLVTFDRQINSSPLNGYKYFFSKNEYIVNDSESYDSYYLKSTYKTSYTGSVKNVTIETNENMDGIYHLYIMAQDSAGNSSFLVVKNICVDAKGPTIVMLDSKGNLTYGGSNEYITVFNYDIDIEEIGSKLNLNSVYYKWVDSSSGNVLVNKQYTNCAFNYSSCRIKAEEIELPAGLFDPNSSYKFIVEANDYAGNSTKFISNSFKIDTTAPVISIDVEDRWYTGSVVIRINANKNNNVSTLNSVSYCLNSCGTDGKDLTNFKTLAVTNYTNNTSEVSLSLITGINTLYVYAVDVFGNYAYESKEIKYDALASEIVVNNLNESNLVDVSEGQSVINFTINDEHSGISKYCIYYGVEMLSCYENVNSKTINRLYEVASNGDYYIEAYDLTGIVSKRNVKVVGADKEPISFDLVNSVPSGKFTNELVTISVTNIRKFMDNDVSDLVKTIDYITVDEYLSDYSSMFDDSIVVYNKTANASLVTSFNVSENKIYVVRVIDTANNISYKTIAVTCIDKVEPFINTDPLNSEDRIYLTTESGNNIAKTNVNVYKYGNETLIIKFARGSFNDEYNGYNSYLAVKVCFDEGEGCIYNGYRVNTTVNGLYVMNNSTISVTAPYHFEGVIRYYLVDGAGNETEKYFIYVNYVGEVENVTVNVKDDSGEPVDADKKYNNLKVEFSNYNNVEIDVRYALVSSNVDLEYMFANRASTISNFLNSYNFVTVSVDNIDVTKSNVDNDFYLWVYVSDKFGNYNLFNTNDLIRLDTINPSFDDIDYTINRIDNSSYEIVVGKDIYDLYIDLNNDEQYEKVELNDGKYGFSVTGVDSVRLKLTDEAGNNSSILVVNLDNISTGSYGRVYQNGNNRQATVVIYNMNSNNITSFKYIVTSIDSMMIFNESTIDNVEVCQGNELNCYKNSYSISTKGVYTVSVSEDVKLVFYVYVNGNLVYDKSGNLLTIDLTRDATAPIVSYDSDNPEIISTKNGLNYEFSLNVEEKNLTNKTSIKYILTKSTSVSSFESTYNGCVNSDTCARSVYSLNDSLEGSISINGNMASFNNLATGTYYIYTYVADDFGNGYISKSNAIYVDNTAPTISYNDTDSSYKEIASNLFATKAITLKFSEDHNVKYFNVYNSKDELIARCDLVKESNNVNCNRDNYEVEGSSILYNLDTGNYRVVVFDTTDNSKEVTISIDGDAPVIELYKYYNDAYIKQPGGEKLYNTLSNLYLKVNEINFNYVVIDLYNSYTNAVIKDAVRYSYNSEIGRCLVECEYGKELKDVLVTNAEYNKIVIRAYDKSNRYSELVINYDDVTPVIWTKDVGESIKIDGAFYEVLEDYTMNFEIGVNNSLNLDRVLNAFIVNVDNMSYMEAKAIGLLNLKVYKEVSLSYSLFEQNVFDYIGNYKIEISYTDNAGNSAEDKVIYISLEDNTNPEINFVGVEGVVELNEQVNIPLLEVSDNYGLDSNKTKKIFLGLEDGVCIINNEACFSYFTGQAGNYKFNKVGVYQFSYTISDISSNSIPFSFAIEVRDTKGPDMQGVGEKTTVVNVGERNSDSTVNVQTLVFTYPSSYDIGDDGAKEVTYLGLFGLNSFNEKYKMDDVFQVSDVNRVLTYKFNKVGKYYLRFMSSDNNGNGSVFEYEVIVKDVISPKILGVANNEIIDLDLNLGSSYDVSTIIQMKNIRVTDNYDENLKLNYLKNGNEITFSATDSSSNSINVTVFVKLVDNDPPVVGELKVPSSTNTRELYFEIIGGSDNSNEWSHEYSLDKLSWETYVNKESKIMFGEGVDKIVQLCIRARDTRHVTEMRCSNIVVDTKAPVVEGVRDGIIIETSVDLQVTDSHLISVVLYKDEEVIDLNINNLPYNIAEKGNYYVVAKDSMGNISTVGFVIDDNSEYMNIVNDINSSEYTITAVDFDERMLVRVSASYDINGDSRFVINLDNVQVASNSTVYVLGVVPNTDASFVIYSLNGATVSQYKDVVLLAEGEQFKAGINNEDCFVKIGDSYYAYLVVNEDVNSTHTTETNNSLKNEDDSGVLKVILMILGSLVVLFVGYQIIKLKRRVRAA